MINPRKAAIIGCGNVGASIAFCFLQRALFSELVLIDRDQAKAEGEEMDLSHGLPYTTNMDIYAGTYADLSDAAFVVITAGASQRPGETRLDLIHRNIAILREVMDGITKTNFEGILLIVSNPVDILTYAARRISGYPRSRVIGSGTVLDTGRLKYELGRLLHVDSRNVHAFIVGEHGDSELAVLSGANISGVNLDEFFKLQGRNSYESDCQKILDDVRTSAYAIIERKGATYYGIAMAVARIAQCILRDEERVLPVSVELRGEYGQRALAMSVPAILGKDGIERVLEIPLSDVETEAFQASAATIREIINTLELE